MTAAGFASPTTLSRFASTANGEAMPRDRVANLPPGEFRQAVIDAAQCGARVSALFGHRKHEDDQLQLYAVLSDDLGGRLQVARTQLPEGHFPSLTPECPQVHLFEREIAEQFDVRPVGHPWLKPVRLGVGATDFYQVAGDEVHEVAVGPVHAGIIEPGHFRFQCHGEEVFHLEISLGYQHRGIERAVAGGPNARTLHCMETIAGDTTVGHATAYCLAMESLCACRVPARPEALRGIALELERMANHAGDLGALAGDVGFLPTAAYCGRLRGELLNLTALVCGNRFGRGLVRVGGVGFDVDGLRGKELLDRLAATMGHLHSAVNLLWNTPSVMARFEDTGQISLETCHELGLVGPAARACGATRDVRKDHPAGVFRFAHVPVSAWEGGDVSARAYVRWLEIQRSARFIQDQVQALPAGHLTAPRQPPAAESLVISLVEGWRGEICHVAMTDAEGRFERYKIVDPSFHNWAGLAMALRDGQISDFPLCNKSFNLSYCGHDL